MFCILWLYEFCIFVGPVGYILSCHIWTALRKLTFGAYLMHGIWVAVYIYSQQQPLVMSSTTLVSIYYHFYIWAKKLLLWHCSHYYWTWKCLFVTVCKHVSTCLYTVTNRHFHVHMMANDMLDIDRLLNPKNCFCVGIWKWTNLQCLVLYSLLDTRMKGGVTKFGLPYCMQSTH